MIRVRPRAFHPAAAPISIRPSSLAESLIQLSVPPARRIAVAAAALVVALLALVSARAGFGFHPITSLVAYAGLMLLPGLGLYLLIAREADLVAAIACSCAASPVVVVLVTIPVMLAGGDALWGARITVVVGGVSVALAYLRGGSIARDEGARGLLVLVGFIAIVAVATAYLPMTDEWWRMRSDAWAHRAYIAEIADFGIPPMDPYFLGFPLQYMWAYHVLSHTISATTHVDPFRAMHLVNTQSLAGFVLATYLFAGTLITGFARRMLSAIAVTLSLNAAFWVFLPVKLLRALTGETRGWDEVARQLTISPFDFVHAAGFMKIFHNKTFLLDKFMVATAFSLGLCLMAVTWWSTTSYLRSGRSSALALASIATLGLVAFHSLVASAMFVGVFGGLFVLFLVRRGVEGYSLARSLRLAAAMLGAGVLAAPYAYSILHSKETVGQTTLALAATRVAGVVISVAFVAVLAWFQRWMLRDRSVASRFVLAAAVVVAVYAFAVPLPGPNNFDKPVFFIFFPLAVVGAWSLVDLFKRRPVTAVVIALLAFAPVNVIALSAAFNTKPTWSISEPERAVARWIGANTGRDAVFLDVENRVPFTVLGPRRHYWGRISFADQWGYDRMEMSRRYHAWKVIYSNRPMDANTLRALGGVQDELYVVVRHDRHPEGLNVTRFPEYFEPVHRHAALSVYRVNTQRCRADAGRFPALPDSEILLESGLR